MAETPPNDPPERRSTRTPAVRPARPRALSPEPITEHDVPRSADGVAAWRDVEMARLKNERRRDSHVFVRETLPQAVIGLALIVLIAAGGLFVLQDRLEAEVFLGYFVSGILGGAVVKGTVRRPRS